MQVCVNCHCTFKDANWLCPKCNYQPEKIASYYVFNPELDEHNNGFSQKEFHNLFNIEAKHFWFISRNYLINWAIKQYFDSPKNMLELGCGTGYVLSGIIQAFPSLQVYGSDISTAGLTYAAKRISNTKLLQFDAKFIPFENEFDIVGVFDVLEHIDDDTIVMSKIYKAVATGGGVLITVPQHQFLWSSSDESAKHFRRYSCKQLQELVVSAGFELVRVTSFVSVLFPLMMLSRYFNRGQPVDNDNLGEMEINRFINFIFEKMLAFERLFIKLGVNFPFGGSLLMVARKV